MDYSRHPRARGIGCYRARGVSNVGNVSAFDPASVSGLLSRFLDITPTYHVSTLDSRPILTPEESGTLAIPRGQTCLSFDGTNDYAISGTMSFNLANAWTISMRIKAPTTLTDILSFGNAQTTGFGLIYNANRLQYYGNGHGGGTNIGPTITTNTWYTLTVTKSGSTVTLYVDGASSGWTLTSSPTVTSGVFGISYFFYGTGFVRGAKSITNVSMYSVAKTAGEVLAIHNQYLTPTTLDNTSLVSRWWLNEESGTTAYDSFGNNDLTLTNGPTWATDTGVNYNPANWLGHTVNGAVIVPRNEATPTEDAAGASLGVTGPLKRPATIETRCLTVGGTEYLTLAHLVGTETVVSSVGTSTASVVAGQINLTAGTISSIVLSDGTTLPLQEGPGSSNTNRTCYDVSVNARHATIVNGTVATMWAGYTTTVRDWCVENGGGISANGAFVPGRVGTGLDAEGNTKTLTAGKHGNPYSLLVRNPWSAPELVNIGIASSSKIAPSVDVQAASVVDTQFNRILASGSDRYLAYQTALTGGSKTEATTYTT